MILNIIAQLFMAFLWWLLLFPILLIVATPYILIVSVFSKAPYRQEVSWRYAGVVDFWKENAWLIPPW
jgi:hypothetical protein